MVSFVDLQFNPEEDNVVDNMIMSSKQIKILINKITSLLLVESIELKLVEQLNVHSKSFEFKIQKLRDVTKERHDLFMEQVKKIKDTIDLMVAELKSEMAKEVENKKKNYTLLDSKVNFVATTIINLVEFNTDYSTKLEEKSEKDYRVIVKLEVFLTSIKESISKFDLLN
ncbi:unnamed protein product [Lactuca saligna]|uniref:Uncharacterized protein n=1 Tax=Lactuca saligna TaxID=75948 RepID=A0AA35V2P1_LACSI|nr:unnamed protein product [Lactuca saligna]